MSAPHLATLFGFCGPLLAAIGAGLLAYDAFQGPMRTHLKKHFQTRTKGLLSLYQYLSTTYPTPPYTSEDLAKLEKERDEKVGELRAEAAAAELEYRLLVSNLAGWGFLLVAIGSLAQAAAAWLA